MKKLILNGNNLTLVSNIVFEDLKKATSKTPLILCDKSGEAEYGVEVATVGNLTTAGASFTYANSEGLASMNLCLPCTAEEAKEFVSENLTAEIAKFEIEEAKVIKAIDVIKEAKTNIINMIQEA